MTLVQRIQALAQTHHAEWVGIRRHLHAHPELSFDEHETMAFVAGKLAEWGVPFEQGVTGTGVVATVKGQNPDARLVALRADMDALPIQEQNDVDYKSTVDGVMHACGHDVHTTNLLGAIQLLQLTSDQWEGTVRCIFQPGEECIPGGAKGMVAAGVLRDPAPSGILGQHVYPRLPAGHVGVRPGAYMASADEIHMTVKGKGGHAALPHLCKDPVLATAHILVAAQQLVSRNVNPAEPTVLSFGRIDAQGSTNIIPNEVHVKGTFRAMDETWRREAHALLTNLVQDVAAAHGCTVDLDIRVGYPHVNNNPALTEAFKRCALEYVGEERVHDLGIRMTGEDFSHFANEIPGCFYRLGTASPHSDHGKAGLHTPHFDVDEDSLMLGAGLMAYAATQV